MVSESSNILTKRSSEELYKTKGFYRLEGSGKSKSPAVDCFMQGHLPVEGAYQADYPINAESGNYRLVKNYSPGTG